MTRRPLHGGDMVTNFFCRFRVPGAFALLVLLVLSGGCSTFDPDNDGTDTEAQSGGPRELVFREPFESVWRAVQYALVKYPIKLADMDAGVLETDYVKGDAAWQSPHVRKPPSGGRKYKLNVRVLKGRVGESQAATKVIISKRIEIQRDFFSPIESRPSDGLEEISVLYRVRRELEIEKLVKAERRR